MLKLRSIAQNDKKFERMEPSSIFSNDSLLDSLFEKSTNNTLNTSNLWEDFGFSQNDNRFKDLSMIPCGLVSKDKTQSFKKKIDEIFNDEIFHEKIEINEYYLIEQLSISLLGMNSSIASLEEEIISKSHSFENYLSIILIPV